jgi:hypothetical protein
LFLLAWFVRGWWWNARVDTLRDTLASWPGLVVERIDSRPFRSVRLQGLVDPLAEPLERLTSQPPWNGYTFELALRGFVSAEPAIVERRARALLNPPPGVRIAARANTLHLSGTAPEAWIAAVRERAAFVPGVSTVDVSALVRDGASAREQQLAALAATIGRLEAEELRFVDETDPGPDGRAALERMRGELGTARELAGALGKKLHVRTLGLTDEVGSEDYNVALRARRARWLAEQLAPGEQGLDIAPADSETAQRAATLLRRAARLAITVEDGPAP